MVKKIFFLIGAARSGTTLLGEQLLSEHPEVIYLGEPDYLWQQALGYQPDDSLLTRDATNSTKRNIQNRFKKAIKDGKSSVIVEKTPSNCFRIPFINELFPRSKFIHLIRDGREVALSASKEWAAKKSRALDSKELRELNMLKKIGKTVLEEGEFSKRFQSFSDIYYLPKYGVKFSNYLRRQFLGNDSIPWGPRFPGIRQVRKSFSLLETCAIQWERSVVAAESALGLLDEDRVFRLRYEKFIQEPFHYLTDICQFMGIATDEKLLKKMASKVVSRDTAKWKTVYSTEELDAVMNQISFTLKNLGYETN